MVGDSVVVVAECATVVVVPDSATVVELAGEPLGRATVVGGNAPAVAEPGWDVE